MRIAIAGAGAVGTFMAEDLASNGHDVTLLERDPGTAKRVQALLPQVTVRVVDACEISSLAGIQLDKIDVMVAKTVRAAAHCDRGLVVLGGGVACNSALAEAMRSALAGRARVAVASPRLNTDNAAMIGAAGSWRFARGERHGFDLDARDALPLPGLATPAGVSV